MSHSSRILVVSSLALAATSLVAPATGEGIDYSTPVSIKVVATQAQIEAFTGQAPGDARLRAHAVDSQGRVITFTGRDRTYFISDDPSDPDDSDAQAQLLRIDASGPEPVFETIATYAQLVRGTNKADTPPNLNDRINANSIFVDAQGRVYISSFNNTTAKNYLFRFDPEDDLDDVASFDILRLHNGISKAFPSVDGQHIYICQLTSFGAPEDNLVRIPLDGGSDEVVADYAQVGDATGIYSLGFAVGVQVPNNDLIVWDEAFRTGSDQILRVSGFGESATVSVEIGREDFGDGVSSGGVEDIAVAPDGTLFVFNRYPDPLPGQTINFADYRGIYVFPPKTDGSYGTDARFFVNEAALNAATGLTGARRAPAGGFAVWSSSPNQVTLYHSDYDASAIIAVTWEGDSVEPGILGDINGDGVLNVADVTALANLIAAGTPPSLAVGDVNGDESVNEADVEELSALIVNN